MEVLHIFSKYSMYCKCDGINSSQWTLFAAELGEYAQRFVDLLLPLRTVTNGREIFEATPTLSGKTTPLSIVLLRETISLTSEFS